MRGDSKAAGKPEKKPIKSASGNMNPNDIQLFQEQLEKIIMSALKKCRMTGNDSPPSDPSDDSSSANDDDVKKRRGGDDKNKVKKSKNKSPADKQDPKQSLKEVKGSKSVKSRNDKKVSSPKDPPEGRLIELGSPKRKDLVPMTILILMKDQMEILTMAIPAMTMAVTVKVTVIISLHEGRLLNRFMVSDPT